MNKLAGKELQSLPSQINAGYGEGAAAPDPLSAGSRAFISTPSPFRSPSSGGARRVVGHGRGGRAGAEPPPGLRTGFKGLGAARGPRSQLGPCQGGLRLAPHAAQALIQLSVRLV